MISDATLDFDAIIGVSPSNMRQADEHGDLTGIMATIRAAGLLQKISVHPAPEQHGKYLVHIGGRRWAGCRALRDADPARFAEIDVKLYEGYSDAELRTFSTMENSQHRPPHPVREYESFAAIVAGSPPDSDPVAIISTEFGLTRREVRQRLALGSALSPKIRDAWRAGTISAEAAKAYAECDDIAAQEAFFAAGDFATRNKNPHSIRAELLAGWLKGDDRLACFVGAECYVAAGGVLRDSLFAEEQRFAKALVEKLARGKLLEAADRVKREEFWGFVVTEYDADFDDYEPMDGLEPDYLPRENERLEEIRAIMPRTTSDPAHIGLEAEAEAIHAKAICRALPMAERLTLGVKASIDWRGVLKIDRAIIGEAPDENAHLAEDGGDDDDEGDDEGAEPKAKTPRVEKPAKLPPGAPIGKQLRTVLDETIAHALHDAIGRHVNLALIVATARMGCAYGGSSVYLSLHPRRNWRPARELLVAIKGLGFAEALAIVAAAPLADVTTAFCELIGASIDPARNDKIDEALDLLRAGAPQCGLVADLQEHFDAGCYFLAATRDAAIAAIREMAGEAAAIEAGKAKAPQLRERATLLARDNKWLPPLLRDAETPIPWALPEPAAPTAPTDTRTTAQAMFDALEADEGENDAPLQEPSELEGLVARFITDHVEQTKGASTDHWDMDNAFYAFNKAQGGTIFEGHEVKSALIKSGLTLSSPHGDGVWRDVRLATAAPSVKPEPATPRDRVNAFIIACCDTGLTVKGGVKASALSQAYNAFAATRGWPALTLTQLATALAEMDIEKHRLGNGVHYKGLALRPQSAEAAR